MLPLSVLEWWLSRNAQSNTAWVIGVVGFILLLTRFRNSDGSGTEVARYCRLFGFLDGEVAVEASADEQHSESVVVSVAEASGDAAGEFDESNYRLGATVVGAACGEVGQEGCCQRRRVLPSLATSGTGQLWKESKTFSAICRPAFRSWCW